MEVGLHHYIALSLILFAIGAIGVVVRRNVLIVFMSVELMLNAVNISLIAFDRYMNLLAFTRWTGMVEGKVIVFFVLAVAAAEAAVGLGIVIAVFRNRNTVYLDDLKLLRG